MMVEQKEAAKKALWLAINNAVLFPQTECGEEIRSIGESGIAYLKAGESKDLSDLAELRSIMILTGMVIRTYDNKLISNDTFQRDFNSLDQALRKSNLGKENKEALLSISSYFSIITQENKDLKHQNLDRDNVDEFYLSVFDLCAANSSKLMAQGVARSEEFRESDGFCE